MSKKIKSNLAIPPGEFLLEVLEERCIPDRTLAFRIGISEDHFKRLLRGETELTREMAVRIGKELNTSVELWEGLEKTYRQALDTIDDVA